VPLAQTFATGVPRSMERRINRLTIPACDMCGSRNVPVIGRAESWLYLRCSYCAFVSTTPKPGTEAVSYPRLSVWTRW
jgi:hypothetical protein